jgi:hypothetical protein
MGLNIKDWKQLIEMYMFTKLKEIQTKKEIGSIYIKSK